MCTYKSTTIASPLLDTTADGVTLEGGVMQLAQTIMWSTYYYVHVW